MKLKLLSIIALVGISLAPSAGWAAIRIIVHVKNPTQQVSRKFLADAFLRKITFWKSGEAIAPVDLDAESKTRREFSDLILLKPVTAVRNYWQQMIFSGQSVPPVEFDSEKRVIQYVAEHPNSIAYVSDKTPLEKGVKAIPWK